MSWLGVAALLILFGPPVGLIIYAFIFGPF